MRRMDTGDGNGYQIANSACSGTGKAKPAVGEACVRLSAEGGPRVAGK
jgi:hypothetical protein